ncbi:hypothetical protein C8R45DRAFT_264434 [Mycena sanguinolenta]|nr:hypothetical protein C8R45DRAFT_264434 [Mycena sanguinolenta]
MLPLAMPLQYRLVFMIFLRQTCTYIVLTDLRTVPKLKTGLGPRSCLRVPPRPSARVPSSSLLPRCRMRRRSVLSVLVQLVWLLFVLFWTLPSTKLVSGNPLFLRNDIKSAVYGPRSMCCSLDLRLMSSRLPEPTPTNPGLPQTPLYNSLTTNLPHPIMCFQADLPFPGFPLPPSTPVFPVAAHVQSYLESYTAHFKLTSFIRLNALVIDVVRDQCQSKWKIQLHSGESFDFDLVIVANGHHRIPRYPNVPGLESWLASKKATHSVWYRHGQYLGDKILVVGGGPSGIDISAEMRNHCTTLVRSFTGAPHEDLGNVKLRGRLTKLGPEGQAFFEDGSVETDISAVILATGYQVSFPFLTSLFQPGLPPPCPPLPETLYNSSYHLFPLARHIFPIQSTFPPTSLVFMGLPVRVAPFPVLEAQAAAILHAFAYPEALDVARETRDLLARYAELSASVDGVPAAIARKWSVFEAPDQFIYQDQLYEFAGLDVRVPQWRKDMYYDKKVLRSFWVELERRGEANDWVHGVGESSADEWILLLQKLLKAAQEWESNQSSAESRIDRTE